MSRLHERLDGGGDLKETFVEVARQATCRPASSAAETSSGP